MATIERDVSLLQRRRVAPIYIVYGSAVQIKLNMIDYTIPENATVEFFVQCGRGPVYRADGSAIENSAVFTPPEGFFQQGDNALQLEINGRLIPLALEVKCEERISGVGSEETPEQVRPLVLQAQDAAKEARSAASSSAGYASDASGSAWAAAGSAESAGQSANAAAGSAESAAESANSAKESKTAAAGSAQAAEASKNAAANSANSASDSASSAAGSALAAAGSAQEALESKNAAAGSAMEALESKNAAAGSASAAAGSAGAAASSAQEAQEALEKTTSISVRHPYIGANGNWFVWSLDADAYVDSGVKAQGPQGVPGPGKVNTVCGVNPDDSGNVALTAENVGARPDNWVPSAADVGARPGDWVPTAQEIGAVAENDLLSKTYPVGAIYLSAEETSPASLFGGTWERLKDRFLLAAGDSYTPGATGGEAEHTLTVEEMPQHAHVQWLRFQAGSDASTYAFQAVGNSTGGFANAGNTSNTGGGKAHNNMPPYLAVYMWKRVA